MFDPQTLVLAVLLAASSVPTTPSLVGKLLPDVFPTVDRDADPFELIEHYARPSAASRSAPEGRRIGKVFWKAPPRTSGARERFLPMIRATETRYQLPGGLLDALVSVESSYDRFALSKAGAAGLTQLMPGTAHDLGVSDRFDILTNLDGGARYLRAMIDRFGSISLGLAAYNAGPGSVERARGLPNNGETPAYVTKVIARWTALKAG